MSKGNSFKRPHPAKPSTKILSRNQSRFGGVRILHNWGRGREVLFKKKKHKMINIKLGMTMHTYL